MVWPNGLRENAELQFGVGDLDLPERRNTYTSSREETREDAHMCPCGKAKESRTHIVGEYTRRNGMCWRR